MKKKRFDFNFRLILTSKTISIFGGNILGFAMILFLVDFTRSAALLGIISAISQIPTLFLTPFAGMIADRLDKKKLIIFFDVLTAISNFYFLWLLLTQNYTILNITILRMIKMSIMVFARTVFNAAVPRVVEEDQLIAANGALQSIGAVGFIAGSVVGGILFDVIGIQMISFASGMLFLVSAGLSMLIKIPRVKMKEVGGMLETVKSDMIESLTFLINKKPALFKITLVDSVITFLLPPIFTVGLPFIVDVIFGQPVTLSFGVAALGMLLGGISARRLEKYLDIQYFAKLVGILGGTGLFMALAFSPIFSEPLFAFWLFNIALALLLFMLALTNSSLGAFIQKEIPEHLLGKVNALFGMIGLIAGPLGLIAVGFLIETVDLPLFFLGTTVIIWLAALAHQIILKNYLKNRNGADEK